MSVSFFNLETNQFDLCTTMKLKDMEYNGQFLISANSGNQNSDHVYIKSFKLFDPATPVANFHFQEARKVKADQEISLKKTEIQFKDLLHMRKQGSLQDLNRSNFTILYQVIPNEHQNLIHMHHKVVSVDQTNQDRYFEMINNLPDQTKVKDQATQVLELRRELDKVSKEISRYIN